MRAVQRYGIALSVFGGSLAAYLLTLCPTVYVEGSGELIGAVCLLGTPHPTGYPLFCLVGRLFCAFLPFESPAFQVNVATAFTSALAAGTLTGFLRSRGCGAWAAVAGGLALAFSNTFWSQSVIAEVYGLGMLFAVLVMAVGVRAAEQRDERLLLLAAFLAGLGLTAHLSQVLLWPGLAFLLVRRWPGLWRRGKLLAGSLLAFLGGYSLVLYLPLRNGRGPGFHGGRVDTPSLLWDHLSGALYRGSFFSMPWEAAALNGERWLRQAAGEFHPLLIPLIGWGMGWAWKKDRNGLTAWGFAALANLIVALNYHRDPNGIGVFFLLSFVALSAFLGYGVEGIGQRLGKGWSALFAVFASMAVLLGNWREADRSGNWIAWEYGRQILESLPERAALITEGDDASFIVDYLHRVEGVRPDVAVYNRDGRGTDLLGREEQLLPPRIRIRLRREREAELIQRGDRPVFFAIARQMPVQGYAFLPEGLVYRVAPEGEKPRPQTIDLRNAQREDLFRDPWIRKIQANYWFMLGEQKRGVGDRKGAASAYRKAAQVAFDSRTMRFNVALMLYRLGDRKGAWEHAQAALRIDPWKAAPYRLLARIARQEGRMEEAYYLLKRALLFQPRP